METRLQRWGNSDGIRIPSIFLKSLNLKTNDIVELVQETDKIIIFKPKKEKISLKNKLENYNGNNVVKDFVWDEAKGKEIW